MATINTPRFQGNATLQDGYVDALTPAQLPRQTGVWMSDLLGLAFHSDAAEDAEAMDMVNDDVGTFGPAFADPGGTPVGLTHGEKF